MKKIIILLLFAILSTNLSFGEISNVKVNPSLPYICNAVNITAAVSANNDIEKVTLNFRIRFTPSVFIPIEMTRSTISPEYFEATIPSNAVTFEGLEWYIVAKDEFGTLQFHGTPETPNALATLPFAPPNKGTNRMTIRFKRDNLLFDCLPLSADLIINAYHDTFCGEEQKNSSYTVLGDEDEIIFIIKGDSDSTDDIKDGFEDGERIMLTVSQGRFEYLVRDDPENPLVYSSGGDFTDDVERVITTVAGIEITGNETPIDTNATIASSIDGTDFGKASTPVTHTFTIANTRCVPLRIGAFYIDGEDFVINGMPDMTDLIPPGETRDFSITYLATKTSSAGIRIYSNAFGSHLYKFTISGEYDGENTSVESAGADKRKPVAFYNSMGIQLNAEPENGVYIIVYDNGSVEKRMK